MCCHLCACLHCGRLTRSPFLLRTLSLPCSVVPREKHIADLKRFVPQAAFRGSQPHEYWDVGVRGEGAVFTMRMYVARVVPPACCAWFCPPSGSVQSDGCLCARLCVWLSARCPRTSRCGHRCCRSCSVCGTRT